MSEALRQEELLQYAEAFAMYDVEDEQRILLTQLPLVLSTLGKAVPEAQIEKLKTKKASEGNDPYLTFDEFLSLLGAGKTVAEAEKDGNSARAEALRNALSLFDIGASGFIFVGEAQRALAEVMSEAEFDALAAEIGGPDSAGRIHIDSLVKIIVKA